MEALIKNESMDFATLKFQKVEKFPEISHFHNAILRFSPVREAFFGTRNNTHEQVGAKKPRIQAQKSLPASPEATRYYARRCIAEQHALVISL
jgi:hypothetical protein